MNYKRIPFEKIKRIINHLAGTGAKVTVVFFKYPNFYIDAKWPTGRHWQIMRIE
jgi:hypothetical protein